MASANGSDSQVMQEVIQMASDQNFRSEHDSIGDRTLPKDAYYGVQSLRAAENFHITGLTMHPEIINSIAEIKKASAITNAEIGLLDKKIADAIVKACDEIADGEFHDSFIVDPIQGGAGTSLNMNANEVIANRGEVIAAVAAVIAEDLGKDANAIRIKSFKKII